MAWKLTTTIEYPAMLDAPKTAVWKAVSAGLRFAARVWHRKVLRGHFKRGAGARYGYAKRKFRYIRAKVRKGRFDPLVWSGQMRRQLLRAVTITASRKHNRAIARMKGPRYLRSPAAAAAAGQPDMMAEIKMTDGRDLALIARAMHRRVVRTLNDLKRRRKRKRIGT